MSKCQKVDLLTLSPDPIVDQKSIQVRTVKKKVKEVSQVWEYGEIGVYWLRHKSSCKIYIGLTIGGNGLQELNLQSVGPLQKG